MSVESSISKHITVRHFNELDERIKQKVSIDQCEKLASYIQIRAVRKQIYQMLEQINPTVHFYKANGQKLFKLIDTPDGKIGKAYGENIAHYAKISPELMNAVVSKILNK